MARELSSQPRETILVGTGGFWCPLLANPVFRAEETGLDVAEPLSEQCAGHLVVNTRKAAERGGLMKSPSSMSRSESEYLIDGMGAWQGVAKAQSELSIDQRE